SVIFPPAPGAKVRLRLTSTATVLDRPWGKVCFTWPASTVFLSSSFPRERLSGFLASVSLLVVIPTHFSVRGDCSVHRLHSFQPPAPPLQPFDHSALHDRGVHDPLLAEGCR